MIEHGPTSPLDAPLTIPIHEGRATRVEGTAAYAEFLTQKFLETPLNGFLAELGIGTNERAKNPHNILEAEKILGTVHVAFGDNSGFGGTIRTRFHLDHVLFKPTLIFSYPDGTSEILLKDGSFQDPELLP